MYLTKYPCYRVVVKKGEGKCETVYVAAVRNALNTIIKINVNGNLSSWEEGIFSKKYPKLWKRLMKIVDEKPLHCEELGDSLSGTYGER